MSEKNPQLNLGTEPVKNLIYKLGVPIMIGMVFTALDNIGDALFVSGLGVSQLSAILICAPLGQAIVALGLLFGNGAGAYIPRLLGSKDMDRANKVASTALYGSLLLGMIAAVLISINLEAILRALGGSNENISFAITYARVYVPSLLLNIFIVTMNSLSSSEGRAKLVMVVNILTAILNFILNPLCIYTFKMGIVGAAYATVIAQGLATLVLLFNIMLKKSVFNFKISNISFNKEILSPVFKIGVSTLIFQLLTSMATWFTNRQAARFGEPTIAALGTTMRIFSIGTLLVYGFSKGFQAIAGFNFGAKKIDRVRESVHLAIKNTTIFCFAFSVACAVFTKNIISIFADNNQEVITIGIQAILIQSFSFVFFGFYTIYSPLLLSVGKVKEGFILGLCRQGTCLIPMLFILPNMFGRTGIVIAQPVADILSVLITFIFVRITSNFLKETENKIQADGDSCNYPLSKND
ncbi:MATE family efflux transporter [Lacrimispora sp.]|uniref:MATE family efflux transporter n=1 Tax=Lacrimispora sp. TaxID=2719234 RepID=UPI0028A8C2D9|nr:MATE family efflux transporter [Lacrimispora sp.]